MTKLYPTKKMKNDKTVPLANLGEVSMAGAIAVSLTALRKYDTGASDGISSSSTRDATSAQTDTRLKRKMTGSGRSDSSSSKRVFKRVMTGKDKSKRHGLKRKRKVAEPAAWKASSGGGRQKVCNTTNKKVRKTSCE